MNSKRCDSVLITHDDGHMLVDIQSQAVLLRSRFKLLVVLGAAWQKRRFLDAGVYA